MKFGGILIAAALAVTIVWAFVSYPQPAESVQAAVPERILIAYYSQSGHTEAVAKAIQQETGGDLYRIRTNIAYPKNAPAMQSQAKAEYNEGLRPPLAEPMPDMSRYDVVFLGFPNWYNAPPAGVFTFLEQTDWKGKAIVPFVTYGLSGWGSSIDDMRLPRRTPSLLRDWLSMRPKLEIAKKLSYLGWIHWESMPQKEVGTDEAADSPPCRAVLRGCVI